MELIQLPMYIGLEMVKRLKKLGIESRKNNGLPSFEFTQEELNLVKKLNIINPSREALNGIENLRCLEKLSIETLGDTAYTKSNSSITDKDIKTISNLNSLKSLKIDNQSQISWIYLDKLTNLEEIEITRNTHIDKISGLISLHNIKEFTFYGNKELHKIEGINELINNNELDSINLDLLHYDEIIDNSSKLKNIINCDFSETISNGKTINYTFYQLSLFHQKCLEIANLALAFSHDRREQIIFVEKYLSENITYDYNGLKEKNSAYSENGKQRGKKNGTNSAFNGIMYGSAVCEGYTRSMQYILKLMGIKSKNVYCISGKDKISINKNYHDVVTIFNDAYHSIIRVDIQEGIYYCDPCWDSSRYHRGDDSLPYCLLTKNEISETHTLSFEEDNIISSIPYKHEYVLDTKEYINSLANKNEKSFNNII